MAALAPARALPRPHLVDELRSLYRVLEKIQRSDPETAAALDACKGAVLRAAGRAFVYDRTAHD